VEVRAVKTGSIAGSLSETATSGRRNRVFTGGKHSSPQADGVPEWAPERLASNVLRFDDVERVRRRAAPGSIGQDKE
jgi:hypothetical protein